MNSKTLVWVYLFVLSVGTIFSLWVPKNEAVAKDSIVIPGDAIRLRILANSDTGADQALKEKVRDAVNAQIELWVQDLTSKDKAKKVIKANLPKIQEIAEKVVHDEGSSQTVKVQFGVVQFPTKLYGQFLYPAGKYQAVLITLGKGLGANWWCVLFPPLCFLDFSNGVAVSNGFDEQKAEAKTKPADVSSDAESSKSAAQAAPTQDDSQDQQQAADDQVSEQSVSRKHVVNKVTEQSAVNDHQGFKQSSVIDDQVSEQTAVSDNQGSNQAAVSDDQGLSQSASEQPADESAIGSQSSDYTGDQQASDDSVAAPQEEQVSAPAVSAPVHHKKKKAKPVYTSQDEQPVQVKFFVVELWQKLFN